MFFVFRVAFVLVMFFGEFVLQAEVTYNISFNWFALAFFLL